ncbi:hypothetical protein L486_05891 [Kwoniella mangroviensis CBS 10435]|uniref:Rad60/SUMO-like domain-containing protein n=1 Tax=Kwoniella mangroviensis CBS 10435 TaxID=1331196 RepID=A0A1B9INU3_9TREE|nr:hypothetical protein L486_05891 [Kwoniella mangroviensis CBS 10435]
MSGVDSDSEQEYEELKVEKKIAFTVKRSTDTGDLQDIFKLSDQTPFNRLFKAYHDKYGIAQEYSTMNVSYIGKKHPKC